MNGTHMHQNGTIYIPTRNIPICIVWICCADYWHSSELLYNLFMPQIVVLYTKY